MSKKFIIGASIALVLILGVGAIYYFSNKASADVATKDFCTGTSGKGWRNCVANAVFLRGELATRNSTKFKRALENADALRNFVPGKTVVSPSTSPSVSPTPTPTPTPTQTVVECTGVKVYTGPNFIGTEYCLAPGNYKQADLLALGISNDSIASLKVPYGRIAMLFQSDNFSYGNNAMAVVGNEISGPNGNNKATLNVPVEDSVSSVIVYGDCAGGMVFSETDFRGEKGIPFDGGSGYGICLPVGDYDTTKMQDAKVVEDCIESAKVNPGYKMIIYASDRFIGESATINSDRYEGNLDSLSPKMSHRNSSIRVIKL